jgi:hypothetical protein
MRRGDDGVVNEIGIGAHKVKTIQISQENRTVSRINGHKSSIIKLSEIILRTI